MIFKNSYLLCFLIKFFNFLIKVVKKHINFKKNIKYIYISVPEYHFNQVKKSIFFKLIFGEVKNGWEHFNYVLLKK